MPTAMPVLAARQGALRRRAAGARRRPRPVRRGGRLEAARSSLRRARRRRLARRRRSPPVRPLVHDEAPDNIAARRRRCSPPRASTRRSRTPPSPSTSTTRTGRQNALPLETRGVVASWDAPRRPAARADLHAGAPPGPHDARALRCGLAERTVRVIVPDMGGGFGQKCVVGREEIAVAAAAHASRPPREVDRGPARRAHRRRSWRASSATHVRAAFDADGRITRRSTSTSSATWAPTPATPSPRASSR